MNVPTTKLTSATLIAMTAMVLLSISTSNVDAQTQQPSAGLLQYPSVLNRYLKKGRIAPNVKSSANPRSAQATSIVSGAHEDLDAVLWVRQAAEYSAITRQTYRAAINQLPRLLADYTRDAVVNISNANAEMSILDRNLAKLPPCVIMDVDETVLDNSGYQRELILSGGSYSSQSWGAFVNQKTSVGIAGAREFVNACRKAGVRVYFVTNRDSSLEAATRENMISAGIMQANDPDVVLSKGERPEWTSGKSVRRSLIAQRHRVLMLVGDDLNDFLPVKGLSVAKRNAVADPFKQYWGQRWFMMPNPNYGSWEGAVIDNRFADPESEKRKLKMLKLLEGSQ